MSDDDIEKVLKNLFRSEHAPPLTDSVVDALLATPSDCPQEAFDRMRCHFIEKTLAELHPSPVRAVAERLPFGRWLESMRRRAKLTRDDIGYVIQRDAAYMEAIEVEKVTPWTLDASDIAKLITLFRLHIEAFSYLLSISLAVGRQKTRIGVAPRRSGKKESAAEDETMSRVLDEHIAASVDVNESNTETLECVTRVREALQRNRVLELLD